MILCKFCGSNSVIKNGFLKSSQLYKCKNCNHKFFENGNSFVRMRTPSHVIVTSLNMYFDGLSVRKVAEQINNIYGETLSQVSVWNWIQKYSKFVSEYVETLQPKLSGKYHHDETEIKVDGDGRYLWESIDSDTRYIVAHLITKERNSEKAIEVFKQMLQKQRPIALFTDGSFAYNEAFNKVFYCNSTFRNKRVEWVRRVGIRARETNNKVERLHGTFKDRYKPMRGLKTDNTAKTFLNGYIAYYNFCRKHQTIGKTPAEAAGLQVKGWRHLIENAQVQKTENENEMRIQEATIQK